MAGKETRPLENEPQISLDISRYQVEEQVSLDISGISVEEQSQLGNIQLRKRVTKWILVLFCTLNFGVLLLLGYSVYQDTALIAGVLHRSELVAKSEAELNWLSASRLVTPNVLMTLLGATTVQMGAAMIAITQYLFPRR